MEKFKSFLKEDNQASQESQAFNEAVEWTKNVQKAGMKKAKQDIINKYISGYDSDVVVTLIDNNELYYEVAADIDPFGSNTMLTHIEKIKCFKDPKIWAQYLDKEALKYSFDPSRPHVLAKIFDKVIFDPSTRNLQSSVKSPYDMVKSIRINYIIVYKA